MATFFLIRHGTTAWVDQQLLHGITDIPLNDNGLRQAARTAEALKGISAGRLLSSPLTRAMQTAEIIGQIVGLTPEPVEGFREIDFGWMEGKKTRDDTMEDYPLWLERCDHYWMSFVRLVSGESLQRFRRRITQEWEKVRSGNGKENIIIVAHSGVLGVILESCLGNSLRGNKSYYVSYPCSITEISVDEMGRCIPVRLNDYAHLSEWYPNGH